MSNKIRDAVRIMRELAAGYDRSTLQFEDETVFLKPDRPTSGHALILPEDAGDPSDLASDPELFVPPAKSLATRLPPARTKGHSRGYYPNPRSNRLVSYASLLEFRAMCFFLAKKRVVDIVDQPPAVTYVALDGKVHKHTPDYLVVFDTGHRLMVAVKPRRRVVKSGLAETIRLIRLQSLRGYADEAIIFTENVLTQAVGWNAASTLHAVRARNEEDCDRLRLIARRFSGVVTIRTLIDHFGDEPGCWIAVWNLLFDGDLKHVEPSRMLIDSPYVQWRKI